MYHVNVNATLTEKNVIQIIGEITINVDVNVKSIINMKKVIFEILLM